MIVKNVLLLLLFNFDFDIILNTKKDLFEEVRWVTFFVYVNSQVYCGV